MQNWATCKQSFKSFKITTHMGERCGGPSCQLPVSATGCVFVILIEIKIANLLIPQPLTKIEGKSKIWNPWSFRSFQMYIWHNAKQSIFPKTYTTNVWCQRSYLLGVTSHFVELQSKPIFNFDYRKEW
jgi:hypothetical protein